MELREESIEDFQKKLLMEYQKKVLKENWDFARKQLGFLSEFLIVLTMLRIPQGVASEISLKVFFSGFSSGFSSEILSGIPSVIPSEISPGTPLLGFNLELLRQFFFSRTFFRKASCGSTRSCFRDSF